jgi:MFS family permease
MAVGERSGDGSADGAATVAHDTVADPVNAGGTAAAPHVLTIRAFRGLVAANFFSALAFGSSRFVFVWLMGELTEWNPATAVLGILLGLPPLLLSAWAGSLADRHNPRRLAMFLLLAGAVFFAVPAVIIELDQMTVGIALACAFLAEIAPAMVLPVLQALVPAVVPATRLMQAVAIQNLTMMVSMIGGAFAGGAVIRSFGIAAGFWFLTAASLGAAIAFGVSAIPTEPAAPDTERKGALREGVRYALGTEPMRSLLMLTVITGMAISVSTLLLPELARDVLGQDSLGAGMLTAAMSVGMILTALLLASVWTPRRQGLILLTLLGTTLGGGLIMIGLSRSFVLTMVVAFFWGAAGGIVMTLMRTLLQGNTPPELMGRVMGLSATAQQGAFPVAAAILFVLVSATSVPATFVITGVAFGVLVWLAAIRPHVRNL